MLIKHVLVKDSNSHLETTIMFSNWFVEDAKKIFNFSLRFCILMKPDVHKTQQRIMDKSKSISTRYQVRWGFNVMNFHAMHHFQEPVEDLRP